MSEPSEYRLWRSLDYRPFLAMLPVDNLAPYLHRGQTALEVGCSRGQTTMLLGSRGLDILGIDIKGEAISQARRSAKISNVKAHFIEGDFLDQTDLGTFDLVIMIRVMTCFA